MSNIIILGGTGYAGQPIARYLLEWTDAGVTIAGRNGDKARRLADELNATWPGRARSASVDVADRDALGTALAGHTLVVVAISTAAYTQNIIRAALDAGADYLDVQISDEKLAVLRSYAAEIEKANRCFITEAGYHPGLPSLLVRYAATHLDSVESAITAGYLNMGPSLPYTESFDEIAEMFRNYKAQVFADGRWTRPDSWQKRRIDFGGDIGKRNCYSMYFEELQDMPRQYPSLRETGFFISETHWLSDLLIMPIVYVWMRYLRIGVRSAGWLFWWSMHNLYTPPVRVELTVVAKGRHNEKDTDFQASIAHADGYDLTAIPIVATLMQYLEGPQRPGLWMMGHYPEPERAMADMERMGATVHTHAS